MFACACVCVRVRARMPATRLVAVQGGQMMSEPFNDEFIFDYV